jgi:PAS domain S-box-containing protein
MPPPEAEREVETEDENEERRRPRDPIFRKGSCPSWLKSQVNKGRKTGKTEKGLLELQELIIRYSPVGTAVLDNRGRVRIRNESFMESLELEVDDVIEDIDQVAERMEGVKLSESFWDAVETGSTAEIEEEALIGGRSQTSIRVSFSPVSLPSGKSWCICYLERIPKQIPASALSEYQNYVAQIATSSGDAIVGLDHDGCVKYWNRGAQALFGYTEEEMFGKSVMTLVPEELRREAQVILKVVHEKGVYRNFDTHRLHKSGERVPVTMTVSAVRDENGKFIGTAATCKDLRVAKDLHEKSLEAEKLNAVLQMAMSVYHQINNPLSVIAANAQLLMPKLDGEDREGTRKLDTIIDATKRINTVLEDLTRRTGVEPRVAGTEEEEEPAA